MKVTQKKWVVQQLEEYGEISRNECLNNFISRLGAIIATLKSEGWEFETEYKTFKTMFDWSGKDYIYKVVTNPNVEEIEKHKEELITDFNEGNGLTYMQLANKYKYNINLIKRKLKEWGAV